MSGQGSDFVAAAKEEICDVFSGKWVFDNSSSSYPLHKESECPYMSDQLACQKHGRPDLDYQHWRWQPHPPCNLKRWNVTEMWEMLRGKRLMFVGDSLNRGQWISMVCLLQSVIPRDKQSMSPNAHLTIFRAEVIQQLLFYNKTLQNYPPVFGVTDDQLCRITMPRWNSCGLHCSSNPTLMTRSITGWMNGSSDQIQFSNMHQSGNMLIS